MESDTSAGNGVELLRFRGTDVELVADATGPEDGMPILFLHGSGQTRQSWGKALHEAAKRGYRAISLDMRGHGDSGWAPDGAYSLDAFADDLIEVLRQLPQPAVVVGASLGGLTGMLIAGEHAERLRALILVDITAKVEMEGAREVVDFMGSAEDGFASLEEAADAVAAYLPHRPRPKDTSGLARNLRQRGGRWYWHWDPAFMNMNRIPTEEGPPPHDLPAAARQITVPTLLVRGGRSRIVSDEGAKEFLELVPHAEYADIAGAHHMVAGDANDAFNDAVFGFVDKLAGE
ncbi:alpha/beta fold hydrolase [Stakelama tenebrarum]|uniref:Alpha/beta hydrolase n=1 Tax=Stakelama tenebrarum TaxID=2711215 RepID=A0A6G6Y6Z2_9SPHN|nr:alpha/beta hydrolase [Sphingosinithalassobacter tenebrarum]QIG80714.1 alpha/beta hydrolase [Sphingosinithalassobacter tenebrarum]